MQTKIASTVPWSSLLPQAVWAHFATLCRIPRASKQEAALRDHLQSWAADLGLHSEVDGVGNLIIRKPASAGGEHLPAFVLQAHLDMVCQANSTVDHDFSRDSIVPVLRDGWLLAEDTTLGADNGIGVALIMAVLADTSLIHGPLEALLTVDEEAGMGGARGLEAGRLQGRCLLNLDTEAWGEFYMGCAGGLDIDVARKDAPAYLGTPHARLMVHLQGLRGGHSGVDIHEGRGNAIKLLVHVLLELDQHVDFHLRSLHGGTARNALPREASAELLLNPDAVPGVMAQLSAWQTRLQTAYAKTDPKLGLEVRLLEEKPEPSTVVLSPAAQAIWLHSLNAAPHGVWRMSDELPGTVETSNNLGMVRLSAEEGRANFMLRSLVPGGAQRLASEIGSLWALTVTDCVESGFYPGWAPSLNSPLLERCQKVFADQWGQSAQIKVIHAGLECGLIADCYPDMDIVSFGPNIRGAHAPGEAVDVASVARVWKLLCGILEAQE